MTWRLLIPAATPSQNVTDRRHWAKRYGAKTEWWWRIRAAEGFLEVPRAAGRRRLTVERHARTRPQDEANVFGGCKGIVDDLVHLGLLVDDAPAWLEHGTPRHVPLKRGEKPFTILHLEDIT